MTTEPRPAFPATRPGGLTPSQTIGPFFAYALTPETGYDFRPLFGAEVATPDAVGERITLEGYVLDGDGEPVVDAMIEIWQADGEGRYAGAPQQGANASFRGFGRAHVDTNGFFSFATVKPGPVEGPDGTLQAPHVDVAIFARGLLRRLFTRAYFEGESANAADPILAVVPEGRRPTLVAAHVRRGTEVAYVFNIRLQGEAETVFFQD